MINILFILFITASFASNVEIHNQQNDIYCEGCQFFVNAIEEWIKLNETESVIESKLEKLCNYLPKYSYVCKSIIVTGIPKIIELIEKYENPQIICKQIGVCNVIKINDIECEGCTLLIGAIEKWIEQNDTETMIIKQFEKICSFLPKYVKLCDSFIAFGIPKIIKFIENYETPALVCAQIKLCPKIVNTDIVCEGCVFITNIIEKIVFSNKTIDEIEKNVEKICNIVLKYSIICDNIVEKYIPLIVILIKEKETPETICKQIGLCY